MIHVNPLIVGVLGGMGSYSTLHFFESILGAFDVEKEWERPRIIIDNHCVLPSRVRAILYDEGRRALVEGMAGSIRGLLAYDPHLIAIPCNTAHCFLPEVRRVNATHGVEDDRVLDMIDLVADRLEAEGHREVFLMATEGTIDTRVYEAYCDPRGVRVRNPSPEQLREIRAFIEQVKQRRPLDREGFARFVADADAPAVVLGCTELSSFFDAASPTPLVDPIRAMVDAIAARSAELGLEARNV